MEGKNLLSQDKALSGFLVLVGFLVAGWAGFGVIMLDYRLVVIGVLLGVLASVLEFLKEALILKESIKGSFESMQGMPGLTITSTGNQEFVQRVGSWVSRIQTGITKTMGKVMLVFYKVSDFGVKALAGLCGLIYILFPRVELLGLWIILSAILLAFLSKFSGLFGMLSPLGRTERSKRMVLVFSFFSLSAWVAYALSLWAFFMAFGVEIGLVAFFFFSALFAVLSLTPFTFDGIGVIELIGMGLFYALSAPLAIGFMGLLFWEVSKLMGDFAVSLIPEKRVTEDLSEYR